MSTPTSDNQTFHLFSNLPPELRNYIWQLSLPDATAPTLFSYKTGCWHPRQRFEGDEGFDPGVDGLDIELRFCHERLDPINFDIPTALVNREAHSVAVTWAQDHGIERQLCEDQQCAPFVRRFRPLGDAIYVADDQWMDFLCESDLRLRESDLFGKIVALSCDIFKVALPLELLQTTSEVIGEMFDSFPHVEQLVAIVDSPVSSGTMQKKREFHQCYHLETIIGGYFFWDNTRCTFDFVGSKRSISDAVYYQMESVATQLHKDLIQHHLRNFEFRLATAVER